MNPYRLFGFLLFGWGIVFLTNRTDWRYLLGAGLICAGSILLSEEKQ